MPPAPLAFGAGVHDDPLGVDFPMDETIFPVRLDIHSVTVVQ